MLVKEEFEEKTTLVREQGKEDCMAREVDHDLEFTFRDVYNGDVADGPLNS